MNVSFLYLETNYWRAVLNLSSSLLWKETVEGRQTVGKGRGGGRQTAWGESSLTPAPFLLHCLQPPPLTPSMIAYLPPAPRPLTPAPWTCGLQPPAVLINCLSICHSPTTSPQLIQTCRKPQSNACPELRNSLCREPQLAGDSGSTAWVPLSPPLSPSRRNLQSVAAITSHAGLPASLLPKTSSWSGVLLS